MVLSASITKVASALPEWFPDARLLWNVVATVGLFALVALLRHVVNGVLRTADMPVEDRRRRMVRTRNAALVAFAVSSTVVWASELQSLALSLVAMAAAVAISIKEILMCVTGGLLRRGFGIGDRIEVGVVRGDVLDMDPLTTTLLEVGPGLAIHQLSGRTIVIPNSMFLTSPVINERFTDRYVLHVLTFPVENRQDVADVEARLMHAADLACAPFIEDAHEYFQKFASRQGIEPPSVDPSVYITVSEASGTRLLLRFPVPSSQRGRLEQAILRRVLAAG